MINEQSLTEKLKYLVKKDTEGLFNIESFFLDISYARDTNKSEIEDIEVTITFDYLGTIDPDSASIGYDISNMCNKLKKVLIKNGITKEGKMTFSGKHFVYNAEIWNIKYTLETDHIFEVTYRITYP